jgi:hypothetical protein
MSGLPYLCLRPGESCFEFDREIVWHSYMHFHMLGGPWECLETPSCTSRCRGVLRGVPNRSISILNHRRRVRAYAQQHNSPICQDDFVQAQFSRERLPCLQVVLGCSAETLSYQLLHDARANTKQRQKTIHARTMAKDLKQLWSISTGVYARFKTYDNVGSGDIGNYLQLRANLR